MAGQKSAIVFLADGFEEIECISVVDILRRAKINVTLAGLKKSAKGRSDVTVEADTTVAEAANKKYDAVIIPGGQPGVDYLSGDPHVESILKAQEKSNGVIAAICAAPLILHKYDIGTNKNITSYPSIKDDIASKYKYQDHPVVTDGNLITSRGPGTAVEFSLSIVKSLVGKETADQVSKSIVFKS